MNNPNSFNENNIEVNDNQWTKFAKEMENEKTEIKESERLEQELDSLDKKIVELSNSYDDGIIPRDIFRPLGEEHDKLEYAIKEAKTNEAEAILPESQKEAFREYANSPESIFTFDAIAEGINSYSQGESLEDIKNNILSKDWHGADEEFNRARGESVFNKLVSFLDKNEK